MWGLTSSPPSPLLHLTPSHCRHNSFPITNQIFVPIIYSVCPTLTMIALRPDGFKFSYTQCSPKFYELSLKTRVHHMINAWRNNKWMNTIKNEFTTPSSHLPSWSDVDSRWCSCYSSVYARWADAVTVNRQYSGALTSGPLRSRIKLPDCLQVSTMWYQCESSRDQWVFSSHCGSYQWWSSGSNEGKLVQGVCWAGVELLTELRSESH